MKNSIQYSSFKGYGTVAILIALFFNLALWVTFSNAAPAASPAAMVCVMPSTAGTEAQLNNAIDCFNGETAAGTYVISITQDIALTASTMPISNTVAGVELVIAGDGFMIDGQNTVGVRPMAVYTDTIVTVNDLTLTGGNITAGTGSSLLLRAGGGIQNFGDLTLNDSQVISNSVRTRGGGIYNYTGATLKINDSLIDSNEVTQFDGGGIENRGTLLVVNSTISNNTANRFSGGIGIVAPTTIMSSTIKGNSAVRQGGGIYNNVKFTDPNEAVNITDSVIADNSSGRDGGGIFNDGSGLNIYHSTLSGNTADADLNNNGDGGALNLTGGSEGVIENVTISGNSDLDVGGVVNAGTFTFTHVTIISNTGAVNFSNSGTLSLINTILAGGTIDCVNTGTIAANINSLIQTNDVTNPCAGAALAVDPQLEALADNGGSGQTHLPSSATSPVVMAGVSNCAVTDQRGVSRAGGACEIGATELVGLAISDAMAIEGTGGSNVITFTLTRSDASVPMSVTVNTTSDTATAGSDFTAITNQVVAFDNGSMTKDFAVTLATDSAVEQTETFTVTLSNPVNVIIGIGTATGTITDDDTATLTLSGGITTTEGDAGTTSLVYTATLSAAVDGGFSVAVATSDGSATTADGDYTAVATTLSFSGTAGETKTVTVDVLGDMLGEPDENLTLALGAITTTTLGSKITTSGSPKTITIEDDDAGAFALAVASTNVTEANVSVPVTVTLTSASVMTTSVMYQTSAGTASIGSDYTFTSGTLTFAPGETVKTFNVSVLDDTADEMDETFGIELSNPAGASLSSMSALTMTIVDNDGVPSIGVANTSYMVDEDGTSVDVIITLSNSSSVPVSVTLKSADVNATAGSDYSAIDQVVLFAASELTKTVTVFIADDSLYEGDETLSLTLSDPENGMLSVNNTTAVITIEEDDMSPMVMIQDQTINEGNTTGSVTFTVSLTQVSGITATISYETQDGAATVAGGDYVAKSGTLEIPPGQLSADVVVTINGDTTDEGNEDFALVLTAANNATLNPVAAERTGTVTLTNDDGPTGFKVYLPIVVR